MSAKTLGISAGVVIGAIALTALVAPSCKRGATPTPTPTPSPEEAVGAGTVTGTITLDGEPPRLRPIKTTADPLCPAVDNEKVIVGANGGLANVVVRVLDPPGSWPVPEEPVKVDQNGCRYVPHVLAIRAGQKVEIRTSDPTTHNVHAYAGRRSLFNESMPANAPPRVRSLAPDQLEQKLVCDVHPWMAVYVRVIDHPFFAVTDPNGAFRIEGVPAGERTLEIWHEHYGTQELTVTVVDGAVVEVSAAVKADD